MKTTDGINKEGKFERSVSSFRSWITKDGNPGSSGEGGYPAEKGRYHLYVSYACPWANRTLIMRKLKGLEDYISVSVVNPIVDKRDWTFEEYDGVIADPVFNVQDMRQLYQKAEPAYDGYVSVPVLFDKKTNTIVNNESSEIIRMLNEAFDDIGAKPGDYYPEDLRSEIDTWNDEIYDSVNNGVYKAGFAKTQANYKEAVEELFRVLDKLDAHLEGKDYLVGDRLTEADIRLFVTLIRFDPVYVGHFKCNLQQIREYKNLSAYTRSLYQIPEFKETINFDHIKKHYYMSHLDINPTGIVPEGPSMDYLD